MSKIPTLIDKQDTFEIVRDMIGFILLTERDSQKALALAANKDQALWDFDVYTERSNPFAGLAEKTDGKPIVHISWDTSDNELGQSNVAGRQRYNGLYNIDIIARGVAVDRSATGDGQLLGDQQAFENAQRVARLVRNILMATPYRHLDMVGTVANVFVTQMQSYRPEPEKPSFAPNIAGVRISFNVTFNEFAPGVELSVIEELNIKMYRESDGKLLLESEFQ